MMALRRSAGTWLPIVGVALAALWPLTAYALSPLVLPGLLFAAAAAAVVIRRPEYGVALTVALSPLTNLELGGWRPMQVAIPLLALGLVVYGLLIARPQEPVRSRPLAGAVLVFAAAAAASSIQALNPVASLTKLFGLFTAATLFFAVLQLCRERRQLLVATGGVVGALLVASAQGLAQWWLGVGEVSFPADGEAITRVQGSFGHPNQYAGFLAFLIPVAVGLLFGRRLPVSTRALACAALGLALPAITLSYTRAAIAGLVLGSLIWLVFLRPQAAALLALVAVVAGGALAPTALIERIASASGGDPVRADLRASALDIYAERPVLGVGLNNFKEGYAGLSSTPTRASQRRLLHEQDLLVPPHANNLYVNILAEEGVIGFGAFVVLALTAGATALRGARLQDEAGRAICLGLGAGLMTVALQSLFDVTLFTELSQPLFALLAVAASFVAHEDSGLGPPSWRNEG